ncbi:hypothetical protein U9M48_008116 [Paspalum notatum var. saurae]|uniref:F-box domain-containing protein n=1 Tax=Paspalum notatum var. saurae TaxID=547442 RepID=A0AAQ3SNB0_PASNO
MSKKQRTKEPSSSSSGPGVCSSASARAPPRLPDVRGGEDLRSDSASEGGAQARVPDLGEDLVLELLMRAEARTLASAACVSRGWRQLAREERLWIHPTHLHLDRQCPPSPLSGPVTSWQAAHGGVERMPKSGMGGTTRRIPGDVLSPAGPPTMSSTGGPLPFPVPNQAGHGAGGERQRMMPSVRPHAVTRPHARLPALSQGRVTGDAAGSEAERVCSPEPAGL